MFNNRYKIKIAELENELSKFTGTKNVIEDLKANHTREVETLEHKYTLAIKDLEFNMKNFKDNEILEKNKEIKKLTNSNAVLTKENEMMNKMVDINADIVDVKGIINQLINKLPEVNLSNLTINTESK